MKELLVLWLITDTAWVSVITGSSEGSEVYVTCQNEFPTGADGQKRAFGCNVFSCS